MGAPSQGAGIPPEFYDNIQKIKESSERLEKSTKYLVRYTYAILGSTLIMTGIAIATALHLFK